MKSFRWRLLIGAAIVAFGIFTLSPLITLIVMQRHLISFHFVHILLMASFGTACLLVGVWQIRRGLTPFDLLRHRLSDVKDGRATRLEGKYPSEVQPLADELNAFLAHRENVVRNAIARAGDLAHGLKTPLAILAREVPDNKIVEQQIERMRRQIEYHLAHARAAGATTGASSSVRESAEGLIRALSRLHADRNLQFEVNGDDSVRVERVDLDEILGNLLDNAAKWARSKVWITSSRDGAMVIVDVEDDGAGIVPEMRDAVLQRGVRADEAAPGSGLGLAIARELAELYGGTLALDSSAHGGLRARLRLP